MSLSSSFSLFLGILLIFTIYLYKDARDELIQKNEEIGHLNLSNMELLRAQTEQNVELEKIQADNTELNKNLAELRENIVFRYYDNNDTKVDASNNDAKCEIIVREKLKTFITEVSKEPELLK